MSGNAATLWANGLGILLALASRFPGVYFGFPDSGNSAEGQLN